MKNNPGFLLIMVVVFCSCATPPGTPEPNKTEGQWDSITTTPSTVTTPMQTTTLSPQAATLTKTQPDSTWQWLIYDPAVWRVEDVQTLQSMIDPECHIWFDYGSDYPHHLTVKKDTTLIAGNMWEVWGFYNPDGTLMAEHYGPRFQNFFGWYTIPSTEFCRGKLLQLLTSFPWDESLRPIYFYPETTLTFDQAATEAAFNQWRNSYATQQLQTSIALSTQSAIAGTATILALTPPVPYEACQGVVASRLRPGMQAYVSMDTSLPNAVRQMPTKKGALIAEISPGTLFIVLDGPVCADGLTWWHIQLPDLKVGWTAEGDSDSYWLTPCPISSSCKL